MLEKVEPIPGASKYSAAIHNKPYEVTLSELESRYVELVVEKKIAYDREGGKVGNWKVGQMTKKKMLNSTGAELAFGKLFNVYVDFSRRYRSYDLRMPDGRSVDVKHTDQDRGRLIATLETAHKPIPDLFALMVGEFPTFEFRGVIPGDIFISEKNVADLGHGPCYAVDQSRLSLEVSW